MFPTVFFKCTDQIFRIQNQFLTRHPVAACTHAWSGLKLILSSNVMEVIFPIAFTRQEVRKHISEGCFMEIGRRKLRWRWKDTEKTIEPDISSKAELTGRQTNPRCQNMDAKTLVPILFNFWSSLLLPIFYSRNFALKWCWLRYFLCWLGGLLVL